MVNVKLLIVEYRGLGCCKLLIVRVIFRFGLGKFIINNCEVKNYLFFDLYI